MKFTKEELAGIATRLRGLPENNDAKKHTKRAAVEVLTREIAELKKRGYTLERIAESLSASGLPISTPTLKNYLHRARRAAEKSSGSRAVNPAKAKRKQAVSNAKAFDPTPDSDDI